MGLPADMAVVVLEKARDAYVELEVAVRGKKALAERVAAAITVGTRRERASMSLTAGGTLAPGSGVKRRGGAICDLCRHR